MLRWQVSGVAMFTMGEVSAKARRAALAFRQDQKGAVALIFCAALAPLMVMGGVAVDYAKLSRAREKLVIAADAAVVAAVADLQKTGDVTHAQNVGRGMLQGNLADMTQYMTINVATAFSENRQATMTLRATLRMPNQFGNLLGQPTTDIIQESVAQGYLDNAAAVGSAQTRGSFRGSINSDPELTYADGGNGFVDCPAPNWYNALSDSGIQINFACSKAGSYNYIRKMTVLLGSHRVDYDVYNGSISNVAFPRGGSWGLGLPATLTVDGAAYTIPARTYSDPLPELTLVDAPEGKIYLTPYYNPQVNMDKTQMQTMMGIRVVTPVYNITLNYDFGWYLQEGGLYFSATNPGLCGTPGGIWGRSVRGEHVGGSNRSAYGNTAENPYMVLARDSKSPEFYWAPDCAVAVATRNAKVPRLVK